MIRRKFLCLGLGALSATVTGCSLRGSSSVSIDIANRNESSYELFIRVTRRSDDETVFDESVEVDPNETREIEDAFGSGQYRTSVGVDDRPAMEYELATGDCGEISFNIRISGEETLELSKSYCG